MNENEVWKDVTGYEGLYKVSDKGNVFSVERRDSRGVKRGGITLNPRHTRGYLQVALFKNGERKNKYIHRLVTEAFIPNPENHPDVNHLDEIKSNNELSNLEWCTREYNNNYGTRIERLSKKVRAVNVKTGDVLTFNSTREAERKGFNSGGVSQACLGTYYGGRTYKGYRWYYEEEVSE